MKILCIVTALLLATVSHNLANEIIYQENFSDGVSDTWIRFDTTLAEPYGPGIYSTTDLGLRIASSGAAQMPLKDDARVILALHDPTVQFLDGVLSGKVLRETEVSRAGILFRTAPQTFTSYVVDFAPAGLELWAINGFASDLLATIEGLVPEPGQQWHFEVGAESSTLTAKAWPVGETEPLFPQIHHNDSRYAGESFGFHAEIFDANGHFGASFDNVLLTTVCDQNKLLGDLDGDFTVAFSDFLLLAENFGRADSVGYADGDLDCNGAIEFSDFLSLAANFGNEVVNSELSITSVPEPNNVVGVATLGFLFLVIMRQKTNRE